MPAMGTSTPPKLATPHTPLDGTTRGNTARGTSSSASNSSSHAPVWMSKRSVRLAFDGSVQ